MNNIIERTMIYAVKCHQDTNHMYDKDLPYERHLAQVYVTALSYQHLVPELHRANFLAAAWAHDVIEDCRQTYNDVKAATNEEVAELVYALTNEKGKNRKQRANDKYYEEIKKVPYAALLKICDRIANFKHSITTQSKMALMYVKENESFLARLEDDHNNQAAIDLRQLSQQYLSE